MEACSTCSRRLLRLTRRHWLTELSLLERTPKLIELQPDEALALTCTRLRTFELLNENVWLLPVPQLCELSTRTRCR